jgi:hypothetical protein
MSGRGVSDRNNITLGPAKLKVEEQISQTVVDQNIDFSRGTELPTELDPSVYYAVVTSYDAASLTATIVYSGDTAQVPNIANYSGFTLSVDDMVVVAQAIDNNQVIVGVRGSGDTGNEGGGGGTVDPSFPIDPFVDFGIETADQIGFAFGDLTDIGGSANSLVIHRGLGYGDVVVIDLDTGATVNIGTPIVGVTTRSAMAIINGVIYLDNGKYYDGTWNTWLLPGYVVFQGLKNSFYNKKKEQFYVHLRTSTSPFSYFIAVIDTDGIRTIPLPTDTYTGSSSVGYGDDQVAILKSGTGTQPVYFYEMLPLNSAVTYGGVNDIDDYAANMLGLTDELVWSLSNGSDLFSGIYSIRLTQFNGLSIKYLDVLKSYDEDTELYRTFNFGAINRHVLDTRASIQGSPGQYVVVKPDILQDVDPAGGTFGNVSYPVIYGLTKYGVAYNIWKDLTVSTPSVTRNKVICEGLRWSAVKDRIEFTVLGKIYRVGLV